MKDEAGTEESAGSAGRAARGVDLAPRDEDEDDMKDGASRGVSVGAASRAARGRAWIVPLLVTALASGLVVRDLLAAGAQDAQDTLALRRLELVDGDGRARIRLHVDDAGTARIVLLDEGGVETLALESGHGLEDVTQGTWSRVALTDPASGYAIELQVEDDTPHGPSCRVAFTRGERTPSLVLASPTTFASPGAELVMSDLDGRRIVDAGRGESRAAALSHPVRARAG